MARRVHYEDLIIDLYIYNRLDKGAGRKKTAKLIFLAQEYFWDNVMVGPQYVMKKFPMGPYDNRIKTNLDNLARNGYLKLSNRYYANQFTTKIIKDIDDLIQENSILFNKLDDIVSEYGSLNGDKIADYIYNLDEIGMKNQAFYEYFDYESIIDPRKTKNPRYIFKLDDEWYDTIELLLDPDYLFRIEKGLNDCKLGNFNL